MERNQIHVKLDPETSRKLELVLEHGYTITGLFKGAVTNTYSELTDTVRVPVIGKVNGGGRVKFGDDNGYE